MALVVCPWLIIGPGDMAMAAALGCTANDGMECAFFSCLIAQPHEVCTNYNCNDAAWLASHCGEDVGGWTLGVVVVMIPGPAKAGGWVAGGTRPALFTL